MKLLSTGENNGSIQPVFAYDGDLEIVFSQKPENTGLEQYDNYSLEKGNSNWIVKCKLI